MHLLALALGFGTCRITARAKNGSGPDREGLANSAPILKLIAAEAKNGFPDARGLKAVWQSLDLEYKILESAPSKGPTIAAQNAADAWKKTMTDCINLRRNGITVADEGLSEVLAMLEPDVPHPPGPPEVLPSASNATVARNAEGFPDFDRLEISGQFKKRLRHKFLMKLSKRLGKRSTMTTPKSLRQERCATAANANPCFTWMRTVRGWRRWWRYSL